MDNTDGICKSTAGALLIIVKEKLLSIGLRNIASCKEAYIMRKISKTIVFIFLLVQFIQADKVNAQTLVFKENFDTISAMLTRGWETINKSNPVGSGEWKQGNLNIGANAFSGSPTSYAQVDYSSTDTLGASTISDWLLSPPITVQNNDSVSFYVLSFNSANYPDRLECRMSSMGTSDSVGTNDTTVGNFSLLLRSVNPNLDTFSFPSVTVDSSAWTKYKGTVSGLSGPTSCRFAFRYYVTHAGLYGINSSTIGLDSFLIMHYPPDAGITENSLSANVRLYPNPAEDNLNIVLSKNGDYLINIYSALGEQVMTFRTESSGNINMSAFSKGLYSVQVTDRLTGNYTAKTFIKE